MQNKTLKGIGEIVCVGIIMSGCQVSISGAEVASPSSSMPEVVPAIALDRELIAFCGFQGKVSGDGNIFLISADGHGLVQANMRQYDAQIDGCYAYSDVASGGYKRNGLAWSSTGDVLYWGRDLNSTVYYAQVSVDGKVGQMRSLWSDRGNGVFDYPTSPDPSPDGKLLAVEGEGRIFPGYQDVWISNIDGSNALPIGKIDVFGWTAFEPIWSPDGAYIAFGYNPPWPGIGIAARDGGKRIVLTNKEEPSVLGALDLQFNIRSPVPSNSGPSWYPDSQRLIFVGVATGNNRINTLFRYSLATNKIETLISSNVYVPALSPDGTKIAFVQYYDESNSALAKLVLADSDGNVIGEMGQFSRSDGKGVVVRDIAWSPDGTWLAFSSNYERDMDIYVIRADGKELHNVTNQTGMEVLPKWRPRQP